MRVKNIQIGYDFAPILKLSAIQKLKLFASGENVLTFTRLHKNFDPEVLTGAWGAGKIYPLLKTYSLGLNVTF
jgi:hypothetical protein